MLGRVVLGRWILGKITLLTHRLAAPGTVSIATTSATVDVAATSATVSVAAESATVSVATFPL